MSSQGVVMLTFKSDDGRPDKVMMGEIVSERGDFYTIKVNNDPIDNSILANRAFRIGMNVSARVTIQDDEGSYTTDIYGKIFSRHGEYYTITGNDGISYKMVSFDRIVRTN
jgi:hypothetical protein